MKYDRPIHLFVVWLQEKYDELMCFCSTANLQYTDFNTVSKKQNNSVFSVFADQTSWHEAVRAAAEGSVV